MGGDMRLRNKKTGDIWEFESISMKIADTTLEKLKARGLSGSCFAHSLAQLNNEWEDAEPLEPLIKDEKIRKAVRAWAEAQGLTEVYLASNGYEIYGGIDDWVMQFKGEPFPFADKNEVYTIAELCGEEE